MPKRTDDRPPFLKLFETFGATFALSGSNQAVAECPFCDKEGHFYLNIDNGLYDCKRCGEKGNATTFLRHEHQRAIESTRDVDYARLKADRALPVQTLKRFRIGLHPVIDDWLIPALSKGGEVLNLVRYRPAHRDRESMKLNLPALPAAMFGVDQLSDDATRLLLVCEGPWDGMAADHCLREKKSRNRYDILAVPGAGIFKDAWTSFFKGRKVRLLFDNDDAGRKGQRRTAKILGPVAAEVCELIWPEGFPKGADVSDLVRDGLNVVQFTRDNCRKVESGQRRLTFVRGDAIVEEKVEWLWPYHLQFGTFVSFAGRMGTHKSGVVRDIAARATAGKAMPNCRDGLPPFDVIYFTSEDAASQIRDLIAIAGGDLTRLHVHDIASGSEPVDLLDCLGEIEATINSLGARLVVLDALNSFVGGDISTDSKARRTLSGRLQSLARRTGACIIGIRNWGRADGGTSSQKAMGAASLSDVGRCVLNTLELPPIEKGAPRRFLLEFEKVSNAPPQQPVSYEVQDLSTGDGDAYHRRIIWGKPVTDEDVARAFGKGDKKVAQKGSGSKRTHNRRARAKGEGVV